MLCPNQALISKFSGFEEPLLPYFSAFLEPLLVVVASVNSLVSLTNFFNSHEFSLSQHFDNVVTLHTALVGLVFAKNLQPLLQVVLLFELLLVIAKVSLDDLIQTSADV